MSDLVQSISQIRALLGETPRVWRSIDVRVMAGDVDGVVTNLLCTAHLDERAPNSLQRWETLPVAAPISCHQLILPIGRLSWLLSGLKRGAVAFGKTQIAFQKSPTAAGGKPTTYDWSYIRRALPMPRPLDVSGDIGHYFMARGDLSQQIFARVEDGLDGLNNALRRLPKPWDGVDSVARYFLRTDARIQYHGNAAFELFAPIRAELVRHSAAAQDGTLRVKVAASPRVIPYLRVGYFGASADGEIVQGTAPVPAVREWAKEGDTRRCEVTLDVGSARRVSVFLNTERSNVRRMDVAGPAAMAENPRLANYALTDRDLDVLRGAIAKEPGFSEKHFEKAVARLFFLAGFAADTYAFEDKLSDAPDGIAFSASGSTIVVIECTTGPIGAGSTKLQKLAGRAAQIRRTLVDVEELSVISVFATTVARAEMSRTDIERAEVEHVAVLCHEDVKELHQLVLGGVTQGEVVSFCYGKIPRNTRPATSGLGAMM